MSDYKSIKVYSDGSHYIGIPKQSRPLSKKETKVETKQNELKKVFEDSYNEHKKEKKKDRNNNILNDIEKYLPKDKAKEFTDENMKRKNRNLIERRKRLVRKVRQQQWDYFVTFTYDDKLHTEESFRKTLSNCLKHLSSRNGWRYIGVWERSPKNNRLHFHGLFIIPNMVGKFKEIKDYSTTNNKMQTAIQNTFFLKRFGRNDFSKIEHSSVLDQSIQYLMKYIEKSGERIVYSKGLYTYFVTDVLDEDVLCPLTEDNIKVILADKFNCWDLDNGELLGEVSSETINKLAKAN